jgi:hypothetical protein
MAQKFDLDVHIDQLNLQIFFFRTGWFPTQLSGAFVAIVSVASSRRLHASAMLGWESEARSSVAVSHTARCRRRRMWCGLVADSLACHTTQNL